MVDYRVLLKLQDKYALRIKRSYLDRIKQTIRKTDWNFTLSRISSSEAVYNTIIWVPWHPMPILREAYNATWNKVSLQKEAVVVDASSLQMPNPQAERWLWAFAGRDVTEIIDQDRKAIQFILARGMKKLQSPADTALELENTLGLTKAQTQAVLNYKDSLIKNGIKDTQVTKLTDAYYRKLLNYRAETIAVTETSNAVNQAWMDYLQDASSRGVFPPDQYQLYWLVTPSDRTCDECMEMAGKTGEISTGEIEGKTTPLHPRCRCVIQVKKK